MTAAQKGLQVPDDLNLLEQKLNAEYRAADEEFQKQASRNEKRETFASDVAKAKPRIDAGIRSQKQPREHTRKKESNKDHQRSVQDGNDDDIAGTWQFDMPELTENYQSGDITWEIAQLDSSGFRWASFDLLILEGVVRINWDGKWKGKEKRFAWRGTETGEGEIQYSDSNGGTITFTSANKCIGKWWGAYGTFEFKGKKVSKDATVSNNECKSMFESFNKDVYEYARVARWK